MASIINTQNVQGPMTKSQATLTVPLLGGDSLAFQDKADKDGIIEVELNDPSDELLCNFFLNKEQALQVISQLKKAFEL